MIRDRHDPRCERSTSQRCRCGDCQGGLHGVEASQIDLERAGTRPLAVDVTEALADGSEEGRVRVLTGEVRPA